MPTKKAPEPRTRFRFLDTQHEQVAEEVPLDRFRVTLPDFTPVSDEGPLDDGEPPTKLGQRFRQRFAELNDLDEDDVDHGLIRDVEALSADHDANIQGLAHPYRVRNHAGEQVVVRMAVHTPLVGTALINGRMLSRVGRKLDGKARALTSASGDHPKFPMPRLELDSPEQAMLVTEAQRQVERLRDYAHHDQNFLDSLALEGVITAPVVAFFQLVDPRGNSGYHSQTDDGWRRCQGAREIMSELLGVNTDLSYKHWEDPDDGSLTVRSHTAESIRRVLDLLRFTGSDKAKLLYPPSKNAKSVDTWRRDVADHNPDVRAFHRLRTTDVELVLAVRPLPRKSPFDVFYLDMAGRHVPGLSAKEWDKAGVEGVVAVRAIDTLVDNGEIHDATRSVWLGEDSTPWQDEPTRAPFRNRIVAGTSLMARLTTDGDNTRRRDVTRRALVEHGLPNHPDRAATVAAAQATVVFGVDGTAQVGRVSAALASVFKHASLWKDHEHPEGFWAEHLTQDPQGIHDAAVAELGHPYAPKDKNVGDLGPHQRTLMALTAVAHITNPALVEADHSLTRTGRGGRGQVSKSDAIAVVQRMVRDTDGLARCLAVVQAAVAAEPFVPLDPITGEAMTEEWLRSVYLAEDADDPESSGPDPLDAESEWWKNIKDATEKAVLLKDTVAEMKERPVPPELLGMEEDEYDEETAPLMFQQYGVPKDDADAIRDAVGAVEEFATEGKAFYVLRRDG